MQAIIIGTKSQNEAKQKAKKHSRFTFTLKELPHNVLIRLKKNQRRKHRPRNACSMGSHNKSPFAKISFDKG